MLAWLNKTLLGYNKVIHTPAELDALLSRQAAYIAQKSADDYCRGKAGMALYALSVEQPYRDALAICRWEGYAAVLVALCTVAQRQLIEAGGVPKQVEAYLIGFVGRALAEQPRPAHRPQGWADVLDALPERLLWARREPPPPLSEIAEPAAKRLFDVLPIHANHRELDDDIVNNAIQFQLVGFSDRFRREVDAKALVQALNARR